jgi:hypothetical protein
VPYRSSHLDGARNGRRVLESECAGHLRTRGHSPITDRPTPQHPAARVLAARVLY